MARLIGRNLGRWEGCLVQITAMIVFMLLAWAAFASGFVTWLSELIAHWYASQVHFGPTPNGHETTTA